MGNDSGVTANPPTGRAPTRRFEARRNAIIASAVEELNRKGVRGMTLGDVAARLDLVPTGVIYYFRNKEELAAACFMRAIERFDQLIAEAKAAGDDDRERVRAFIRLYFEFKRRACSGETEQIAVFNDVRALNKPSVNEAYTDMFRHARDLIQGPPGAEMPRPDRNARAHLLLSEIFWSVAWMANNPKEDFPRVGERMAAIMADGLAAPGAGWPFFTIPRLTRDDDPRAEASAELFLRAATELINEEGYHGASVERISARLNVSKGAFYHHNETKDELVVACFQRTWEIMWRAIRAAEAEGGTGLKVLAQICTALVQYQMAGNLPLLRTSALTTVPESINANLVRQFDRVSHRFASILSDGIADGSVRPVDVNVAAQMVTAMINAAAELHVWAPGLTAETAAAHYVRPLFEGLLSPVAG
ncbi:TetR/AcrR family transcriptional regulator [Phenylobacterium sp.]|jgi:AcrR family transcriptional regulator|uniref:TetR/AcrR family transcriptional regulator n=1 Tax=Phenylobacterium sp. TaxID=1871053 RepID=UPI002F93BB2F